MAALRLVQSRFQLSVNPAALQPSVLVNNRPRVEHIVQLVMNAFSLSVRTEVSRAVKRTLNKGNEIRMIASQGN